MSNETVRASMGRELRACAGLPPTPPQHSPRVLTTDVPDLNPIAFESVEGWDSRHSGGFDQRGQGAYPSWHQCGDDGALLECESRDARASTRHASSSDAPRRDIWSRARLPSGRLAQQEFSNQEGASGSFQTRHGEPHANMANTSPNRLSLCFCHEDEAPLPCGLLPSQLSDILFREITPEDYDVLLQLDTQLSRLSSDSDAAGLAEILAFLSVDAADIDQVTCIVCLSQCEGTQKITRLPCDHVFHTSCISQWLLQRKPICPLCGQEVQQL